LDKSLYGAVKNYGQNTAESYLQLGQGEVRVNLNNKAQPTSNTMKGFAIVSCYNGPGTAGQRPFYLFIRFDTFSGDFQLTAFSGRF